MFLVIFTGENWIPDVESTTPDGRLYHFDGSNNYIDQLNETPSRHFTFVFTTFVMMQIFN